MKRRNNPMQLFSSPRCGAKTRSGKPCQAPAVKGKRRCRMHGGNSPGAPKDNKSALVHGHYTAIEIAKRREVRAILLKLRRLLMVVT